jgi:(1->4)-alpha-D-glucan 1-alpha-D-glucosylmutase
VSVLSDAELRLIITELLGALRIYRAYVVPGEAPRRPSARELTRAAAAARGRLPSYVHAAVDTVTALLLGRGVGRSQRGIRDDLIVRFQQTCAAVQAKGVEDTAAYRWTRLVSANEVGSDPDRPAASADEFHAFARRLAENWPATMTTLSTHDTKRQEDVRARIAALAEVPEDFEREVTAWHDRAVAVTTGALNRATPPDRPTEYLLWQTLIGTWPLDGARLAAYLRKAMREAKLTTSWVAPDSHYESAALRFAEVALTDAELSGRIAAFAASMDADARANALSAKLIQLTMPGVPDVYQGCELSGLALVDPDNRRPVDFARRQSLLATLDSDAETAPETCFTEADSMRGLDAAKLLVTSCALRLRRDHPGWFTGDYQPVHGSGVAAAHVLAFCREGNALTIATRLPGGLRRAGGWRDTALPIAPGRWRDVLTGCEYAIGQDGRPRVGGTWLPLAGVLARLPVALLVRTPDR